MEKKKNQQKKSRRKKKYSKKGKETEKKELVSVQFIGFINAWLLIEPDLKSSIQLLVVYRIEDSNRKEFVNFICSTFQNSSSSTGSKSAIETDQHNWWL